jgi:uncharacterized protein
MKNTDKIIKIAKTYFVNPVAGHDWFHVERVYNLARKIGQAEKADMEILEPAALLHDIARKKEDSGKIECHAQEGAKMAKEILQKINYPENLIDQISYAISVHRYRLKINPETLEAKILQDADRLDALGAISIGRVFTYGGGHKLPMYDPDLPPKDYYNSNAATSLNNFFERVLPLKPETFKTETGKLIAKERYQYTKDFVERFLAEWEGKQ